MRADPLVTLAILKVDWDRGHDYIENFIPFVSDCLAKASQDEVSLEVIHQCLQERFGLAVPVAPLRTILRRAARRDIVRVKGGIYVRNPEKLRDVDVSRHSADVARKQADLINKFITFARDRHQTGISNQEAELALLGLLRHTGGQLIEAVVEGVGPTARIPDDSDDLHFLVSSFVAHIADSDPSGYEAFETLVKGAALAGVLYLGDLGDIERRFNNLDVYFDTRFLLRALGHAGPGLQRPYSELLEMTRTLGGNPRCFSQTAEEMHRILDAAAYVVGSHRVSGNPLGESLKFFLSEGFSSSDIKVFAGRIERDLSSLGVLVRDKPDFQTRLSLDEKKLEEMLEAEVHYRGKEARDHDVDSIAAIHRLRRGELFRHLEDARAIFVTTNGGMARAATRFFCGEWDANCVPLCMTEDRFTTVTWLKAPLQAPDLPVSKIIGDCYAALNPSPPLWKRYLGEVKRLEDRGDVSADDAYVLRYSTEAYSALMDLTHGDDHAFAEGTIEEVLERARAASREEVEAERDRAKKKHEAEEAERKRIEQDLLSTQEKLATVENQRTQSILRVAERLAKWITTALFLVASAFFGWVFYLSAGITPLNEKLRTGVSAVLAVFGFMSLLFGWTLKSLADKFQERVAEALMRRLSDVFGHQE